jgi:hypothetical protein
MDHERFAPPECPIHGIPTKRSTCRECNAAYMREYMRRRRLETPGRALWERARRRARQAGVQFTIKPGDIAVPSVCPALGIRITIGKERSSGSPSLDRIIPTRGYVRGNVRVISDKANRLKSNLTPAELRKRAACAPAPLRADYEKIAKYAEQEALLAEVLRKTARSGREGQEWEKIAKFLAKAFSGGRA